MKSNKKIKKNKKLRNWKNRERSTDRCGGTQILW